MHLRADKVCVMPSRLFAPLRMPISGESLMCLQARGAVHREAR